MKNINKRDLSNYIEVDNRILPLFQTQLITKFSDPIVKFNLVYYKQKYNQNFNPNINKIIGLTQILNIYLNELTSCTLNLNNSLFKANNLELNPNNNYDNNLEFNNRILNFNFYFSKLNNTINKLFNRIPFRKINTSIFKKTTKKVNISTLMNYLSNSNSNKLIKNLNNLKNNNKINNTNHKISPFNYIGIKYKFNKVNNMNFYRARTLDGNKNYNIVNFISSPFYKEIINNLKLKNITKYIPKKNHLSLLCIDLNNKKYNYLKDFYTNNLDSYNNLNNLNQNSLNNQSNLNFEQLQFYNLYHSEFNHLLNLKDTINLNKFNNIIISQYNKLMIAQVKDNFKYLTVTAENIIKDLDSQINHRKLLINNIHNNRKISKFMNSILPFLPVSPLLHSNPFNNNLNKTQVIMNKDPNWKKNYYLAKVFNIISKSNEIKYLQSVEKIKNSLNRFNEVKFNLSSIGSNPVPVIFSHTGFNNKPIISDYLNWITKYNRKNKGILFNYSNIIGYNFNNKNNKLFKNIYNILVYSFKSMHCLISKPVFVIKSNKIIIQLFYFILIPSILKFKNIFKYNSLRQNNVRIYLKWKNRNYRMNQFFRKFKKIDRNTRNKLIQLSRVNLSKVYPEKFKILGDILSKLFRRPVEFDLIRLHYPYHDSYILAKLLDIMINRIKLRIIVKRLFNNAIIKKNFNSKMKVLPAFLSGIHFKVAGRLLNTKIVPRKTVKLIRRGAVARSKINYSDSARITNKNKRGAYSITVTSGQNIFAHKL